MPLSCPKCETPLIADLEQQGQIVRCPQCQTKLRLPYSKREVVEPEVVQSVPIEEQAQLDPMQVPMAQHVSDYQPVAPPTPQVQKPAPRPPSASRRRFQKQEHDSVDPALIYCMVGLGVLGILAVAGVLIYNAWIAVDLGSSPIASSPDLSDQVVKREIVMPGQQGSFRNQPAGQSSSESKRTVRRPNSTGQSGNPNLTRPVRKPRPSSAKPEYFDGLFTDDAPTKANTAPGKEQYVYPQVSSDNREYGQRWREFMDIGVHHLEQRETLPVETRVQAAKWARKALDTLAIKYSGSNRRVLKEAEELQELKGFADEPFIRYLQASLLAADGESERAVTLCKKAVVDYRLTQYPARFPVLAYALHARSVPDVKRVQRADWAEGFMDAILFWFEHDFRAKSWEHRFVYEQLDQVIDLSQRTEIGSLQRMLDRLEQGEVIPEWLRLMFKAKIFQKKAWAARGGGYAHTVSDEGWKDFRKYQKLSSGYFEEAHKLSPFFPEAATEMIDIARAGNSKEDYEYWFEQAVNSQFDYMPAYHSMLFTLYPRWHGSVSDMLVFGEECFQTERFETAVPYFFIEAYNAAVREGGAGTRDLIRRDKELQGKLLQCLQGLAKESESIYVGSQTLDPEYVPTLMAILAERMGNFELAQQMYEEIGTDINTMALSHLQVLVKPEKLRARSSAMTGEFAPEAKRLERLMGRTLDEHLDNLIEIKSMLNKVLADNVDEATELYFQDYLEYIVAQEKYRDGEWVDLDFSSGWWESVDFSQIHPISKSLVEIDNRNGAANFGLYSSIRFTGARSIEWEIDFKELSTLTKSFQNTCGLYLAERGSPIFLGISPMSGQMLMCEAHFLRRAYVKIPYVERDARKYRLRVNIDRSYLEVFLNDQLIFVTEEDFIQPLASVGITQVEGSPGRGRIRISNLRVRQWSGPPDSSDPEELEAYYTNKTKSDPEDKYHWFRLGMANHQNENYDQARDHYLKAIEKGLDEGEVAVYLGDLHDRNREFEKANEMYLKAVRYFRHDPAKLQNFNETSEEAFKRLQKTRSRYSIAGARLKWNYLTHPDPKVRESWDELYREIGHAEYYSNTPWFHFKIKAQEIAMRDRFDRAQYLCQQLALGIVPASQEREVRAQKKAYEAEHVFSVPEDDSYRPCYLDSGDLIFFETYQKALKKVEENVLMPELDRLR